MAKKKVKKRLKRNKYRLIISLVAIAAIFILSFSIRNYSKERDLSKYDHEILILKSNGDQIDSMTLKEIRKKGSENKVVYYNNGLEKVNIDGVPIEKIIGNQDINLKDRAYLVLEDSEGNLEKLSMSAALEPDRVYLVYKIDGTPIYELGENYGKMAIIDTSLDDSNNWIKNVKVIDIQ
ncbi:MULTISPECIES: oxidoreductase [Anaerococcus]|uniref:oxidoreductase n=1 Tax=Anaerococcus TaxID=165779 RepID=UPI001AE58B6B|nr:MULTISPECIES: oxidoreductase [Anaerococcus]MBP2069742.1 hypothetical protein [Anaerococcus nagyae]MDU1829545.1 oxidoreductase [Anaerococcus sp.]MDU1863955.1 oxidoreductase [Anaerococcus sp.]MDU2354644.1 oxidoreductase [Anaerococcus sp.]MDU2565575.1 oxidoreductase [Anaerococcus sp.]